MDAVLTPTFQLSLLGLIELSGPRGPIHLTSKKLLALLSFLACTAPQAHSRDKLMTLLWGSHFDAQARINLRQALSRLRRVLHEDTLVTAGESVSLQPGAIACDVERFEALLRDGSREALFEAIGLYKGGLLADIEIPEEGWTQWIGAQRQRLEGLALDAMIKLGERELQAGNLEQALDAANRAIAVSSLREDAHRLVMRVLVAAGRRADALMHYEDFAALLKRELDVEPDPSTSLIAAQLRKRHVAPAGSSTAPVSPSDASAAPETNQLALALPDRPSIAVLPFANMSGDPEQEYFADGMVDDILMALSRVRWLFVIARQSSFIYKVRVADVQQIGRELGVRYVLEGSVRKSGNRVRIVAQLVRVSEGRVDGQMVFDVLQLAAEALQPCALLDVVHGDEGFERRLVVEELVLVHFVRADRRLDDALELHPRDIALVVVVRKKRVGALGEIRLQRQLAGDLSGLPEQARGERQLVLVLGVIRYEPETLASVRPPHSGKKAGGTRAIRLRKGLYPPLDLGLRRAFGIEICAVGLFRRARDERAVGVDPRPWAFVDQEVAKPRAPLYGFVADELQQHRFVACPDLTQEQRIDHLRGLDELCQHATIRRRKSRQVRNDVRWRESRRHALQVRGVWKSPLLSRQCHGGQDDNPKKLHGEHRRILLGIRRGLRFTLTRRGQLREDSYVDFGHSPLRAHRYAG